MSIFITWILFLLFFFLLIISSIFLPRFLVSLVRQWNINITFLGFFLLSVITSLPELLSVLLLPMQSIDTSGVIKSFAVVLGSNLITGTAFAVLNLFYFALFKQLSVTRLLRWSCLAVLFLNIFIILLLFYPDSFLNWRIMHWSLVGLLFVIAYFIFVLYSSFRENTNFNRQKNELKWDFNKIPYKTNPFALFIWIVIFISVLVASVLSLIHLTKILQNHYQLSNWTIGSVFFAFATTSPEIWMALSLYYLGFGLAAWGVIIGSHLFNWILLFIADFTTELDVFRILSTANANVNLSELLFASTFLSFLLYVLTWKLFRQTKWNYLLIPLIFLVVTFTALFRLF